MNATSAHRSGAITEIVSPLSITPLIASLAYVSGRIFETAVVHDGIPSSGTRPEKKTCGRATIGMDSIIWNCEATNVETKMPIASAVNASRMLMRKTRPICPTIWMCRSQTVVRMMTHVWMMATTP